MEDRLSNEKNEKPARGGRFTAGNKGGPGRPRGYRSALAKALDEIPKEDIVAVRDQMIAGAKTGDMQAARLILDRHWPVPKGRSVAFPLGRVKGAKDIPRAIGAILMAVSRGDLSPEEGHAVAGIVEMHRKGIESVDHEERLARLERQKDKK